MVVRRKCRLSVLSRHYSLRKLQVGATRSLSNNLAGQIAGVIAVQRSGEPGYDSSIFGFAVLLLSPVDNLR